MAQTGKILLVDDFPEILELIQDNCESYFSKRNEDVSYLLAGQGDEAVDIVKNLIANETTQGPLSMVFLDIRMPPGIDGVETAKIIRELKPQLPICFCSAYSDYTLESIYSTVGGDQQYLNFLRKPFKLKGLFDALDGVFGA